MSHVPTRSAITGSNLFSLQSEKNIYYLRAIFFHQKNIIVKCVETSVSLYTCLRFQDH